MLDHAAAALAHAEEAAKEAHQRQQDTEQHAANIRERLNEIEQAIQSLRSRPTASLNDADVNRLSLFMADATDLRDLLAAAESEAAQARQQAAQADARVMAAQTALDRARAVMERDAVLSHARAAEAAMLRAIARAVALHRQAGEPLRVLSDVWRASPELDRTMRFGTVPDVQP